MTFDAKGKKAEYEETARSEGLSLGAWIRSRLEGDIEVVTPRMVKMAEEARSLHRAGQTRRLTHETADGSTVTLPTVAASKPIVTHAKNCRCLACRGGK